MSEVKIVRMIIGEDVIAKVEWSQQQVTIKKAFVIIPMQQGPGKPVQLMMSPWMPYAEEDEIIVDDSKVVTIMTPKKDILNSYSVNTSSILTPNRELITETKLP